MWQYFLNLLSVKRLTSISCVFPVKFIFISHLLVYLCLLGALFTFSAGTNNRAARAIIFFSHRFNHLSAELSFSGKF